MSSLFIKTTNTSKYSDFNFSNSNAKSLNSNDNYNNSVWDNNIKDSSIEPEKVSPSTQNGKIDNFKQGEQGDCWLLSSLITLNQSEKGKNLLNESLSVDSSGNVTVSLKGVNKQYTINSDELAEAVKNNNYSSGDNDVIAIELAFEKYRKELDETGQISPNRQSMKYVGLYCPETPLNNGKPHLAIEILTGKDASSITKTNDKNIVVRDNQAVLGGLNEKFLKPYFDNKKYSTTVTLIRDGSTQGHAYTFKEEDGENVYLIDPYDSSFVQKKSKKDFYNELNEVYYSTLDKQVDVTESNKKFNFIKKSPEVEQYLKKKTN